MSTIVVLLSHSHAVNVSLNWNPERNAASTACVVCCIESLPLATCRQKHLATPLPVLSLSSISSCPITELNMSVCSVLLSVSSLTDSKGGMMLYLCMFNVCIPSAFHRWQNRGIGVRLVRTKWKVTQSEENLAIHRSSILAASPSVNRALFGHLLSLTSNDAIE